MSTLEKNKFKKTFPWYAIELKNDSISYLKKKFSDEANLINDAFVFKKSLNFEDNLNLISKKLKSKNKDLIIKEFLKEIERLNDKKYGSSSFFNSHQKERCSKKNWNIQINKILNMANIRKKESVLVIGVNDGEEIKDLKNPIIGLDLSKNAIEKASYSFPDRDFRVGNSNNLDFENSTFDIYLSLRTLSVSGVFIDKSLKEAFRVLKNRGKVIVSIPLWDKKKRKLGNITFDDLSEDSKNVAKNLRRYFKNIKYYRINSEEFMFGKKR